MLPVFSVSGCEELFSGGRTVSDEDSEEDGICSWLLDEDSDGEDGRVEVEDDDDEDDDEDEEVDELLEDITLLECGILLEDIILLECRDEDKTDEDELGSRGGFLLVGIEPLAGLVSSVIYLCEPT